jgi:hypothetical protein
MHTYLNSDKDNTLVENSLELDDYIFDIEAEEDVVKAIHELEDNILSVNIPEI